MFLELEKPLFRKPMSLAQDVIKLHVYGMLVSFRAMYFRTAIPSLNISARNVRKLLRMEKRTSCRGGDPCGRPRCCLRQLESGTQSPKGDRLAYCSALERRLLQAAPDQT